MTNPAEERSQLYHVIMLSFEGTGRAAEMLDRLNIECAFEECEIEGASVVSRDHDGRIHVHEKGGAGWGAAFGTAAAGVLGFVTGPVFLPIMLIVGALAGGVAGHFAGQIVPASDLRRAAESLRPGTSAFIAVVDTRHARNVIEAFGDEGDVLIDEPLETELSNAIREAVLHEVRRV
jgi:uncharacterized membrane protein